MKTILMSLALALIVLPLTAGANAVKIQFNGTGSQNYNGVSSYPYFGTVDGVTTTFMCDSYN